MPLVKNFSTITIALIIFTGLNLYFLVKFLNFGQSQQQKQTVLVNESSSSLLLGQSSHEKSIQLNVNVEKSLNLEIKVKYENSRIEINLIARENRKFW